MNYQLIKHNEELKALCKSIEQTTAIALDTEFMRTRTYYPKIGLIQLFTGDKLALIDPLEIDDWHCFTQILQDKQYKKYFHACSEDIDVFMYHSNLVPEPLLDSQILASFLDNPISSGYAGLVNKYLQVTLDKSETRTDWLARPLSEKQCKYAADDVFYLLPLIETLIALVREKGWLEAAIEECQTMIAKKQEILAPDNAYLAFKRAWQLKGKQLNYLQRLAAWRLDYARKQNIAVNFVIQEEIVWKIARYKPTSLAELEALGLRGKEIRLYGEIILNILKMPVETELPVIVRTADYPDYKIIAERLKQAAVSVSQTTGLSQELLLSRRHINQYVEWLNHGQHVNLPELLSGWRAPLFKSYLSEINA